MLQNIKLKWLADIDLSFSKLPLKVAELDNKNSIFSYLIKLIISCFFSRVSFTFQNNDRSKVLCFFYNHLGTKRLDIENLYNNIINTIEVKDIILGKPCVKFRLYSGFKNIYKSIIWYYQLRSERLDIKEKLMLLRKILEILYFDKFINSIITENYKKYNLVLVFNDSVPYDNFLVQKFKSKKIETATLQHGIILAPIDPNNYDFCGIELTASNSDRLLVWNKFTEKQALKAGICKSKIKVLGIPKCITLTKEISPNIGNSSNTFGVILDGMFTAKNNEFLIKLANDYADYSNMRYILRFHPKMDVNIYNNLINDKCIGISPKSDTISDFCNQVKFSILANSTVFIEMVYYKHKVYRLALIKELSKYKDLKQCSFNNIGELKLLIEKDQNGNSRNREELYEELVTIENIEESYRSFFNKYMNN